MAWKARMNEFLTENILPDIHLLSEILGKRIAINRMKQYERPVQECLTEIEDQVKRCLKWCEENQVPMTMKFKRQFTNIISHEFIEGFTSAVITLRYNTRFKHGMRKSLKYIAGRLIRKITKLLDNYHLPEEDRRW